MQRNVLRDVELHVEGPGGVDLTLMPRVFPTVTVRVASDGPADVDWDRWHARDFDARAFDRQIDALVSLERPLRLRAPSRDAPRFLLEVLTRSQRRIERRNPHSRGAWFDAVLDSLATSIDLGRPDGCARHDHALDRWQWSLRLDPTASAAMQLVALLRDADFAEVTSAADVDAQLAREARELLVRIAGAPSRERRLVDDADALAFFTLDCPCMVDSAGQGPARRAIAATLSRMSADALGELPHVRVRPDVAAILGEIFEGSSRRSGAVLG